MANTYKNIVITPNRSSNTADPKVVYSGGNTTTNTDITLYVYPDSNGTLSWEGSAGQLFSITNDLSNNLFGVNDVSGIPYIEVYANSLVSIAPFGGNVVIGNTAELILSPGTGLHANGSFGTAGQVLTTNGSAVYWTTAAAGVNTSAQYTWSNTHTFQNTITFSSLVNASSLNVVNQTNTATLFVTTSANIASSNVIANTAGVFVTNSTGVVNAAVHSVGTSFIANTTQVTISGIPLSANGGVGTAGQVLTTNGATGAPYWTTAAAGVNTAATYTWTNTHTFQNTVIFNSNVLVRNTATTYVGNTTGNGSVINLYVYPDSNGTLSWEGNAGQLFSITNDLSNNLFGVNDVSGIPYIEVYANGFVSIAPLGGNVVIGNTAELILSPGTGLHANGSFGTAGHVLHTNGSAVYWAADDNSGTVTSVATGNGMTGGPVTTTGTVSVLANTGIVANTTGVFVNATYIGTLSANNTTYVNGKTEGNLNVNNATTAYGKTEGNLNVNSALTANNSTNLGGTAAASYQLNSTLNANIASYLPTYTGVVNGSSHTVGTSFTANATVVNAVSYYAGTTLIGNTTGPYGKTEINLNVNSALTANNSTNLGGTAAAGYQTTAGLSANVATLTANNSSFLGGTAAASYQLNSTLNANIASYLPTYTGVVNGSSHTVGSSFIANSTGVYTGVVNATTISTGSVNVINSSGLTTTANVNIGAAGDLIITAGAGISANGGFGSAGQILASNGSSIYWLDSSSYIRQSFTGDGVTTTFTVTGGYTANQLDVYVNGIKMDATDVTTSSGTNIVFIVAPPNGSAIDAIGIKASIMNYATVNTDAAYTWTNTHSFTNTVTLKAVSANGSIGSAGQALVSNGTSTYWGSVSSTAGSNTQIQFNDSGSANASAGFTFDKTSNNINVANTVNAASHTVGSSTIANSTGVYTGVVNGSSITVGTSTIANSTGVYTSVVNGSSLTVGSSTIANSTGVYTGVVNGSSITVGTSFTANSTVVNAVSYNVGTTVLANSSGVYDSAGSLRSLPVTTQSSVYQLASTDNGETISTTANVTVNGAVLSTGQAFTIFNNSAASITITSGTGVTMYLAGTATTGNRTLSQRGIATILMVASNTFVASGGGLT